MIIKKEVTIYDVARELNFSPSTISRALSGHPSISQKTILVIKKGAAKMGYRPNTLAASLRNSRSNTIGIMISRINRPFISSLITGIEQRARKAGYNVIIIQSDDKYKNEIVNAKTLYDARISGLIVSLSMETKNLSHFQPFLDKNVPVVFVDRVPEKIDAFKVIIDNYQAGYNATKHLIEQGCTRIAHFAGAQHLNVYQDRTKGYLDALRDSKIKIDKKLIINFKTLSFEEGESVTNMLLDLPNPPDGIFSANDTAAVSAIICAKKRGIKIPGDLAIIGFNDDPVASIVDPGLSTVTHPAVDMGKNSAEKIIRFLNQDNNVDIAKLTVMETELVIRESTLKLKKRKTVKTNKNK